MVNTTFEAKKLMQIYMYPSVAEKRRVNVESEGFIVAPKDQNLYNKYFQANILHNRADARYRFCNTSTNAIDHLISGCTILVPNGYINRHRCVGQCIDWKICNQFNIETLDKWYECKPLPVLDIPKETILWDFPIRTDRAIQANRADIIIKLKKNKKCQLIDMSVPSDSNIPAIGPVKRSKYKYVEIEIAKIWKIKTKTTPILVGALGMIKKRTQKYLNEIP